MPKYNSIQIIFNNSNSKCEMTFNEKIFRVEFSNFIQVIEVFFKTLFNVIGTFQQDIIKISLYHISLKF